MDRPVAGPGLRQADAPGGAKLVAFGARRPQDIRRGPQVPPVRVHQVRSAYGLGTRAKSRADVQRGNQQSETGLTQTIQWRLLSPTEHDGTGRTILRLRFEKLIGEKDTVTGSLRASFKGSLSGITGVRMYWPTGGRWPQQPEADVTMEARVKFVLSLNSVRYQAVRVVPDGTTTPPG